MIEYVNTLTRPSLDVDFFLFQTIDPDLMIAQNKYRNDVIQTKGFISLSACMSEDKLSMKIISLWESDAAVGALSSLHFEKFNALVSKYNMKHGITGQVITNILPDTQQLKAKKLSSRLTIEEASRELKEFITKKSL